jgi:hypothetical protein
MCLAADSRAKLGHGPAQDAVGGVGWGERHKCADGGEKIGMRHGRDAFRHGSAIR